MRQRRSLLFALLLAGLVFGCTSGEALRSTAWLDRFRRNASPSGPDIVQMDVALVERPPGDAYLNRDLWAFADEQVVAVEGRALLEDNGFRVGQIGGITPAGLQTLLTSERSCASPHRLQMHAGNATPLGLGPPALACRFQVQQGSEHVPVTFERAQCMLEVVPALAADGRTRLHFVPVVQHGDAKLLPRPTPDHTGMLLQQARPTERYADFGWDVTLAPNEYVVIGARLDRPDTLGQACFLRSDEQPPVQRLLVIRTGQATLPDDAQAPATAENPAGVWSPPLASQAAWSVVRGVSP
jgi:hypothetical protein